jgi:hypothetical protein
VGDDERRPVAGELGEALLYRRLGLRVDRRGRLVEHQQSGFFEYRPRDDEPLALATGEPHAALADQRVVPVGEVLDELVDLRAAGRPLDRLVGRLEAPVPDVLPDRPEEEERLLTDVADGAPEARQRDLPDVPSVDSDRSLVGVVEPRQEFEERRLARAGRPDDTVVSSPSAATVTSSRASWSP